MCNVLYKLASKTIVNRMKRVLGSLIVENQSVILQGMMIFDNAMVVHELLYSMKIRWSGGKGQVAIKLDMCEGYDWVEWGYLEGVLLVMGFSTNFVSRAMACVRIVSFFILLNTTFSSSFCPLRGVFVAKACPRISHLLFADDCFLFL